MDRLIAAVERVVARHGLSKDGQRILVAVSGGLDSMVLLHVLHRLAPRRGWKLSTAHFNHNLRGKSSVADQRLVEQASSQLGCEFCLTGRGEVRRLAADKHLSIEMAARALRHDFLASVARTHGFQSVVLAHHADDQVELFFLRLFRGASPDGLAGMKWCGPSPADPQIKLIRPLLGVPRAELERFANEHAVPFREDASNRTRNYLRNRIRHELLPLIQQRFQPALAKTVPRVMELLGAESDYLDGLAEGWSPGPERGAWAQLDPALQRRVLVRQLIQLGVPPDYRLVEAIREQAGQAVEVSPGRRVVCDETGSLRLCRVPDTEFVLDEMVVDLAGRQGGVVFGGVTFRWTKMSGTAIPRSFRSSGSSAGQGSNPFEEVCFDADKVGSRIVLRHWRKGDRFQPIGMIQSVKLQDLFVNRKVPAPERRRRVVAANVLGSLFWVEGLRIGDPFKLDKATRLCLKWGWQRVESNGCV